MDNTQKFSGKAEVYEKFRPGYPSEVYDFIIKQSGLCERSVIADIGAGTGKFAAHFLKNGYKTVCVEPNADMKKKMNERFCGFENYTGVNATAENTGLPSASVDCITVAQAFHWFDRSAFAKECRRILKPNGKVFHICNRRDELTDVTKEHFNINKKYCPRFKGFSGGISSIDCEQFENFFSAGSCKLQIFENNHLFKTAEDFAGISLSSSYALRETDEGYGEYVAALKELFNKYAEENGLTVKNSTVVYTGEL